ncbi:MAG: hypothetical protein KDC53_05265 [Saprospiraceae bacterium]|nr:hypothetical protein [Saprospiraceae bacterium]
MRKFNFIIVISFLTLLACRTNKEVLVDFTSPAIDYWGRVDSSGKEGVELFWSGATVSLNFEGKSIEALIRDNTGDNYFNIIIDDHDPLVLRPDTTQRYYQLASGLSEGKHHVEIFKRTEWSAGTTNFGGFRIQGNAKVLAKSVPRKRKIEFYGNSITAGYAVEDTSGLDRPDSTFTNHYLSYAAMMSRHYNAESSCICKSGIGITISWFPLIMPDLYDRLNPNDSTSKWDFSNYQPDIVVINLFQNDSWLVNMPERPEFKKYFGDIPPTDTQLIYAYEKFVSQIRLHYPNAHIICALGNMDATKTGSKWMEYIQTAVSNLHDPNMYTHFMPYKGTPGHPSIAEQEMMANSLIDFIDKNIRW